MFFVENGDDANEFGLRSHVLYETNENFSLLLTGEYYARKGIGSVGSFISPPNDTSGLQTNDPAKINPLDTQGFRDNSDVNFRAELNYTFSKYRPNVSARFFEIMSVIFSQMRILLLLVEFLPL